MSWFKSRFWRIYEGAALILEMALRYGLISGAAVAAALGQLVLAGIIGVLAAGVWIRFKRGRVGEKR
jgi:hypothetical protein